MCDHSHVLYHNFPHRPEQGSAQQSVVQWVGLQATAGVRATWLGLQVKNLPNI